MEKSSNIMESLFECAEDYGITTYELAKLKVLETSTSIFVSLATRLIIVFMILIFSVLLNIGIALLLSDWLGKIYYGFFIMASFYLIAVIVLHFFFYSWIKACIGNLIITKHFNN
jgi:hypothetical protein